MPHLQTPPGSSLTARQIWWRWTKIVAIGECIGFMIPTIVGGLAAILKVSDSMMIVILAIAGMGEGAILAFSQWLVLKTFLPLRRRSWIWATAIAAGVAWLIGMSIHSVIVFLNFNFLLLALVLTALIVILLASIGIAQWLILKRYVASAEEWIGINAIAWLIGVLIPLMVQILIPDGLAIHWRVAIGIVSGLMMGVTVAAITGIVLVRLLKQPKHSAVH